MTNLQTSSEPVADDTAIGDAPAGVSPVASSPSPSPRRPWRSLAETAGWVSLFAALFAGWAWYQTGSLSLIAPYLQGERLLFDPLHVVIDNAPPETVVERSVRVLNRSSSSVKLLGSQPSCGCITLDDFPITVPTGQDYTLTLKIGVPSDPGPFENSVKLFADLGGYDSTVLMISGTVNSEP